jgi:hypothetical protein
MKENKAIERLPCPMTKDEKVECCERMASTIQHIGVLETQFAVVRDKYKGDMEKAQSDFNSLGRDIRNGEIYRDIKVMTEPDWEKGVMNSARTDTGEIIRSRPITKEERQLKFPGTEEKPIDGKSAAAGEKPEEPEVEHVKDEHGNTVKKKTKKVARKTVLKS